MRRVAVRQPPRRRAAAASVSRLRQQANLAAPGMEGAELERHHRETLRVRGARGGMQPRPGEVVVDPACGTGGFLLAAHEHLKRNTNLDREIVADLEHARGGSSDGRR